MPGLRSRVIHILVASTPIVWALVLLSVLLTEYRGVPWSEAFSFNLDDGWCDPSAGQGVGAHCFGDFGYPYKKGGQDSEYSTGNILAGATPLTLHLFNVLRPLGYNFGLVVYLIGLMAPTILLSYWVYKRTSGNSKVAILAIFGVASTGSLMAFDRGNHVAWFLPMVVAIVITAKNEKYWTCLSLIVLAGLIKWWGPLLVCVLLIQKRYRDSILALVSTALLNLLLLLLFLTSGVSFETRLRSMITEIFNREYGLFVSRMAVSLNSWVGRLICWSSGDVQCSEVYPGEMILSSAIPVVIALLLFGMTVFTGRRLGLASPFTLFGIGGLVFLAVPEAAAYNLVGASAAALLMLIFEARGCPTTSGETQLFPLWLEKSAATVMALALLSASVPIAWYTFVESGIGSPMWFDGMGSFRLPQLLVPPLGLCTMLLGLYVAAKTPKRLKGPE
jgi:hypothetical protein